MLAAAPRLVALRAGGRAVLLVDGLPGLAVTVAATSGREATLRLDAAAAVPVRLLHRRPAAVEVAGAGARFRAEGAVAMVAGRRGRVREDVVSFLFAPDEPPPRRAAVRAPAVVPVTLVPASADLAPRRGATVDLSGGGALLRGATGLAPGAPLAVLLELPGEDLPIPAAGEVVRATADGLRGVRLDRLRPADRALLQRFLATRRSARAGCPPDRR
jgi:hypothetical protein